MKILYAIQATGNGHLTRAVELVPCLRKRVETDVLVSGIHSEFQMPFEVDYHMQGYGFVFGKNGGIDILKTIKKNSLIRFIRELKNLPIKKYDLIITDFEPLAAWASYFHGIYCVGIGNQYSLNMKGFDVPKGKFPLSKWVLRNYTPVNKSYPLFYKEIGPRVSLPIIRKEIRDLEPENGNFYLIYLASYNNTRIKNFLEKFKNTQFKVFSKHYETGFDTSQIKFYPFDNEHFLACLEKCNGVMTHAGFGLTSEAIFLGKKLCILPMKGQYEQLCNAKFLAKEMGVHVLYSLSNGAEVMTDWLKNGKHIQAYYPNETQKLADRILTDYLLYESLFMNPHQDEVAPALV